MLEECVIHVHVLQRYQCCCGCFHLFIFICMYLFFLQSDRHKLYISSLMLVDSGNIQCRIMRYILYMYCVVVVYTLLIKSVDEFKHYCL